MPEAGTSPQPAPLSRAKGLRFAPLPGLPQGPLDLKIRPGLTLLLGGEGSGKTTVLRWLAGRDLPAAGRFLRQAVRLCWPAAPLDVADDALVVAQWLGRARQRWPTWRADANDEAADSLALAPHLDKALHMLSSGTRRKLGLVEALASGAELTLLDGPFARARPVVAALARRRLGRGGRPDQACLGGGRPRLAVRAAATHRHRPGGPRRRHRLKTRPRRSRRGPRGA